MDEKYLEGKIEFTNLETGFWSLNCKNGKKLQILDIPDSLKKEGLNVRILPEYVDEVSIFMVGIQIRIIKYFILK